MKSDAKLVVIIPTRNRATFAINAVRSVVSAGVPDVSVVVSDNSTVPGDVQELSRSCTALADAPLTYVRPPEPMAMADHWNWALRTVVAEADTTTHITFLSDRMVFLPAALAALRDVVIRHPAEVVTFNFDSIDDESVPVRLAQNRWSGKTVALSSQQLLDLAARADVFHRPTPRMLNCFAPVGLLHQVADRFGEVFGSLAPDYCFAYRCLVSIDEILYYDRPCIVEYGAYRSNGMSVVRGRFTPDAIDFVRAAESRGGVNWASPVPGLRTGSNAVFHEYCFVREEVGGERMKPVELDPYIHRLAAEVAQFEDPRLRADGYAKLREHGWTGPPPSTALLSRVTGELRHGPRHVVEKSVSLLQSRALARWAKKPRWMRLSQRVSLPAVQRFDFASVEDALHHCANFPRPPVDDLSHLGPLTARTVSDSVPVLSSTPG